MCKSYLSNITMLKKLIVLYPQVLQWPKKLCTDKDQILKMQKSVVPMASSGNALILTDQLIRVTIANHDNLISPLIETMDNDSFNDLALDMTAFNIMRFLNEKDE